MAFIGAAIAGVGAIAGGIGGAIIGGNATRAAADTQAQAAEYAANLQKQMYDQQRADQEPWRQAGAQALGELGNPDFQKSFSMQDFQQDPGYQFRLQQGMQALQNSASARGGLLSGNTLKAISDYNQDAASQEYQNAYNRFNNDRSLRFNRLSSLAGLGQTANGMLQNAGQNYAGQVGNAMTSAASAQGAAGIAGANMWSGALGGIGKTGLGLYGMNKFSPQSQSPSSESGWTDSFGGIANGEW